MPTLLNDTNSLPASISASETFMASSANPVVLDPRKIIAGGIVAHITFGIFFIL